MRSLTAARCAAGVLCVALFFVVRRVSLRRKRDLVSRSRMSTSGGLSPARGNIKRVGVAMCSSDVDASSPVDGAEDL